MQFRTLTAVCLLSVAGLIAGLVGCHPDADWSGFTVPETSQHHQPGHEGGPPDHAGNDDDEDDGDENPDEDCSINGDCPTGEACTQGGNCIDATGSESVTEVLQAEIDALPEAVGVGVSYKLPFNAILRIDDETGNGVGLLVEGNAINLDGNGSRLEVENDVAGIRLAENSSWSSIRHLRVDPQDESQPHDGIGVDVRSHGVRLENMKFRRMGTGVRAHTQANDLPRANVNTQQWSRLVFWNNYNHAIHLQSGDSQAGLFQGIEVLGGAGILDESFLGNTYVAPTIQSDEDEVSFRRTRNDSNERATGATTTLGMYVESSSQDPYSGGLIDMQVGGNAIDRFQGRGERVGGRAARLRFRNEHGMQMRIPFGDTAAFGFSHPDEYRVRDDGSTGDVWWRMRFHRDKWGISYQGQSIIPYGWTGNTHEEGPGKYELGDPLE